LRISAAFESGAEEGVERISREFFDHRARSFVVYDSLSISNHARAQGMGFRYYLPPKKTAEAEEILKFAQCVRPGGDFWDSPEVRGVRSRRGTATIRRAPRVRSAPEAAVQDGATLQNYGGASRK
jgi:hypothetical protein